MDKSKEKLYRWLMDFYSLVRDREGFELAKREWIEAREG